MVPPARHEGSHLLLANSHRRSTGLLSPVRGHRPHSPESRPQLGSNMGRSACRRERQGSGRNWKYHGRNNTATIPGPLSMVAYRDNVGHRSDSRTLHVRMDLSSWISPRRDHVDQGQGRCCGEACSRLLDQIEVCLSRFGVPGKWNPRDSSLLWRRWRLQDKPRAVRRRIIYRDNARRDAPRHSPCYTCGLMEVSSHSSELRPDLRQSFFLAWRDLGSHMDQFSRPNRLRLCRVEDSPILVPIHLPRRGHNGGNTEEQSTGNPPRPGQVLGLQRMRDGLSNANPDLRLRLEEVQRPRMHPMHGLHRCMPSRRPLPEIPIACTSPYRSQSFFLDTQLGMLGQGDSSP